MTYTELLERFWDMDRDFSCTETSLYLYLLHRCNSLGWPDTFSLTNDELIERLKCSRNTMRAARNTLVKAGLICTHSDHGRGNTSSYSIVTETIEKGQPLTLFPEEKGQKKGQPQTLLAEKGSTIDPFNVKSDHKRVNHRPFLAISPSQLKEQKQEKKSFPPAPPIKEKKEKKKAPHTNRASASADVRACVCENGQFTMFSEDEPVRKRRTPSEQRLPRDMEEVMAFFERNAADKLPDWETEAKLFFYHFDSLGWMGTSNRKIQDWESRANLWISDKAIAMKNGERTRQTEIDAGGLPAYGRAAGVPKAWEDGFTEPQRRGRDGREPPDAPKDYTKGF